MEYLVIAFRSRSDTIKFTEFLNKNNIPAEIVNTPKEAGVGCGLSAKVSRHYENIVKKAIKIANLKSFAGVFLVRKFSGKYLVRSI